MERNQVALRAIKAFHTLAWFSIEACMVYAGFRGKTDMRAATAAAVVAGETLIFVGLFTLRTLGGIALLMAGSSWLWLTPTFATRGLDTSGILWSITRFFPC